MTLPDYVNCDNEEFEHCDYLIHNDCPGTCAFYKDIGGVGYSQSKRIKGLEEEVLGVGAPMVDPTTIQKVYKA